MARGVGIDSGIICSWILLPSLARRGMRPQRHHDDSGQGVHKLNMNYDNIYNPDICPSSLDDNGEPTTTGETAHKWDDTTNPVECAGCGLIKRLTMKI